MAQTGIPIQIFLILIPLVLVVIFILQFQRRQKLRKAEGYKSRGQYIEAANLFAKLDLRRGVKMLIEVPDATQILVLRHLESRSTRSAVNKILIELAKQYTREKHPEKAIVAYTLAERIWAAAQIYIESYENENESVKNAVALIDQNPHLVRRREDAIRNLSRYAFEKRKYIASAELLKTVGAIEEANALLVAMSDKISHRSVQKTKNIYVQRAIKGLETGDFETAKNELTYAQQLLSKNKTQVQMKEVQEQQIYEIQQILRMIDISRQYLKRNLWQQAQVAYNEMLDRFKTNDIKIPGIIYAELALAYEDSEPSKAIIFYNLAATKLNTDAKGTFLNRAKQIQEKSRHALSRSNKELGLIEDLGYCSVCKMKINGPEDHYVCPHCAAPAHYSHLAEWVKIRGTCPVCRKTISLIPKDQ
ncbi:MAG: hypothetical protein ACFFCZ_05425 [Promethearchaeota archaeon]